MFRNLQVAEPKMSTPFSHPLRQVEKILSVFLRPISQGKLEQNFEQNLLPSLKDRIIFDYHPVLIDNVQFRNMT